MKCPFCDEEIGVTIGTPNFEGAYADLEKAKTALNKMGDGELKATLGRHISEAMALLNFPTTVSLYRPVPFKR